MSSNHYRDNQYWLGRLKKDGRDDLIDLIKTEEITVYKASQIAGYRKKPTKSVAQKLSYHWKRASAEERSRFVVAHLREVNRVVREVGEQIIKMREQKAAQTEEK